MPVRQLSCANRRKFLRVCAGYTAPTPELLPEFQMSSVNKASPYCTQFVAFIGRYLHQFLIHLLPNVRVLIHTHVGDKRLAVSEVLTTFSDLLRNKH